MTKDGRREKMMLWLLCAILLVLVILSFPLGRYPVSVRELFLTLLSRLGVPGAEVSKKAKTVLVNIRAPRILLSCLVGCAISASGAAYQGIFQNPMASPDILGAMKGAAFGVALALLLMLGRNMSVLFGFVFGLLSLALVLLIAAKAKGQKVMNLILAGIIISALFEAGISFIKLVADPNNQLPAITYWLMGSLNATKKSTLTFAILPMAAGLIPLYLLRWQLGVLTVGEDEARAMGVNVPLVRTVVLLCSALLTATSVAVSGVISWVGLVVPHLARKIVGANYRYLLPASMLIGAIFLLVVDNISRNLFAAEIPLGILTAMIGAPFFLYLMLREGRE